MDGIINDIWNNCIAGALYNDIHLFCWVKQMGIFSCDYGNCNGKPYMEYLDTAGENSSWGYLCFWHYLLVRIHRFIHRDKHLGFADVDTDREFMERIMEEITSIQYDLMEIKEKLGIKSKVDDKLKELWDNPEDERWNDE